MEQKKFSIIIPTYNENEKTIELLESIENSEFEENLFSLEKIYVIASGTTTKLNKYCKISNLPVTLVKERKRNGKAHAINLGLEKMDTKYIILMSGDISLEKDTIQKMLEKLTGKGVGIVTGRPIPSNNNKEFVNQYIKLVWKLHDLISQKEPKAGEIIAFKNLLDRIPEDTAADEELIKVFLMMQGYTSKYAREAKINNNGPTNCSDLFEQRRRICIGHLDLEQRTDYNVPTTDNLIIFDAMIRYIEMEGIKPFLIAAVIFEFFARFKGFIDYYIFNRNPYKWKKVN
ncbi:MAG: glycosyltransferase family 2 protein [Candidatus Aenigmatarchaeota archaeon]